ncbi:MAG: prepilin peptidase [Ethanoligenens sp.]
MTILIGIFIVIFGLVFGSFLNVCIYRIPLGESFATGRSHCMACGHELRAPDLIPVFSYLFLHGKCRYCGAKISVQYPLIELMNAFLYLALYLRCGWHPIFFFYAAYGSALIVTALIDIKTQIIPNGLVLFVGAVSVIGLFFLPEKPIGWRLLNGLLGLLAGGLPLYAAALLSKGGMGLGDVKLAAACGLLLGWQNTLLALFFAVVSAGIFAGFLVIMRKRKMQSAIAFGPFLSMGFGIALLCGSTIITWYLHLLGI